VIVKKVLYHQRLPHPGQFSIERLFEDIRGSMPGGWIVEPATCPFPSNGVLPRVGNIWHASRQTGDIHHIVGDVHYLAFGLPSERTVLTIHDCAALNRLCGWKREVLRFFWFTGPFRRAAVITSISETTKDELRRWVGVDAEKVLVIPNCVGSEFIPTPKVWDDCRPICLQVGTKWNKNVERVAEALRGTPCRLEIVGELSSEQRRILYSSGIQFLELGRVTGEALLDAYHRCDFLAFVSVYEGFGLPILEAQAVGRPVITSNRSSMPETAGDAALLVDPESVACIRAAVERLLQSPELRRDLVEKGYANVAKYKPEIIAAKYAAVYESLMGM
jgi:glycosyltransferase involved in cell wall biosynthesis